ncbi:MAG TPA: O-antigen ligase family protein [bacterium]|nr:O-antigen ligase family protein [bacterium]
MSIELLSLFGITLLSLLLFKLDIEKGMKIILLCSVLLHKELFSFYSWNLLPIRFVMLAFSAYATLYFIKNYKKLAALISDPFVLSLGLLFLARLISISNTKNLGASVSLLAFFATACAFVIFTYSVYKDKPDKILEFIKYYINVAFYLCVFGFIQVLVYSRFDFIMGALWNIPGHTPRVGSLFWDTNHFGGFLTGLLPVTGVLFLFAETYKERLKYFIYLVSMSAILLLTSSRTAWIAGFVSLLIFGMLLIYRKLHLRGVLALVFTLFLLTIPLVREYNIKSSPFRAKVKDYFHYRIDSFDSHVLLLKGSVEIFEKYPLIGGGYGGFFEHFSKTEIASEFFGRDPAAFNTRVPPHTIWGELLSETGALGLAAFVAVIGLMLSAMLYASQKLKNAKTYFTVSAMVGAIVGWLTAGIFYSYNNEFFWIILAFYFVYTIGVLGKDFTFSKAVNYVFDSSRSQFFGLFVLGVVVFFTKLGSNHLIPWDEAIYAKIAKNIYQTGDYIFLKWSSSELWLEKPPLYMWLMALSMKIFSITSFAVRLPSALFGLGTVLLTYVFGTKLYGRLAGFFKGE